MRTNANGTVTAILMLVPMLAVPLFAVVGIPQFVPVDASPSADEVDFERGQFSRAEAGNSTFSTGNGHVGSSGFGNGTNVELSLLDANRGSEEPAAVAENDDPWRPPADALNGWQTLQRRASGSNQTDPEQSVRAPFSALTELTEPPTGANARPAPGNLRRTGIPQSQVAGTKPVQQQPLTWNSAVRRLNELGIRQFRLQPGRRASEFHFVCFFTPSDNPRVTHRFEAEADQPLRAVQKVLDQIDEWNRQRTSE